MSVTLLDIADLNNTLRELDYRGWSFEYDKASERYCLSIFDPHNPEDEIVFFLHAFEPHTISHAIRYKKGGTENQLERKHYLYKKAQTIIASVI